MTWITRLDIPKTLESQLIGTSTVEDAQTFQGTDREFSVCFPASTRKKSLTSCLAHRRRPIHRGVNSSSYKERVTHESTSPRTQPTRTELTDLQDAHHCSPTGFEDHSSSRSHRICHFGQCTIKRHGKVKKKGRENCDYRRDTHSAMRQNVAQALKMMKMAAPSTTNTFQVIIVSDDGTP